MQTFALAALVLFLAACAHTVKLPSRGVDVDVRVHVGSAALQGGTAVEPARCTCCTQPATGCTCRKGS